MSRPSRYTKTTKFAEYQRHHAAAPYSGDDHDTEFDNIELSLSQTQSVLNGITRSDGQLTNGIVTKDSLGVDVVALISQKNMTARGAWVTGELYNEGDLVTHNGATYCCLVQHVAGTFALDVGSYWFMLANSAISGVPSTVDKWIGDGVTQDYALAYSIDTPESFLVFVNGLAQVAGVDYTVTSTTLHFDTAPPAPAVPGTYNVMAIIAPGVSSINTVAAIAASNIDLATGGYFYKTISGVTTFTVSNVPAAGTVGAFVLELTNGGSATVNWWAGVKWDNTKGAPALTASGVDILGFVTRDGGTTWYGMPLLYKAT